MITLANLFDHYDLNPHEIKLVRHGKETKEFDILDKFRNEEKRQEFENYQCFQKFGQFSDAKTIAAFAPTRGNSALFLGLWDINGPCKKCSEFNADQRALFEGFKNFNWDENSIAYYDLQRNRVMDELSERLVIDWGNAPVVWVQKGSTPKNILEIKAHNPIDRFKSYDEVLLRYQELKQLLKEGSANSEWVTRLSAVKGVYLIRDRLEGKLYVGSAYGDKGIYGRWAEYAKNGHGNNQQLKELDYQYFEFSILETLPFGFEDDAVIARESRWKERLGTREFGLNSN
ncbi:GIY-YIG nuclease family protein [Methylomonas sp. HW2-6]|uniref:GIY-YIG nuclease family protein n=1 Tax=Methylomonas sp. HW2-6 TaxID=3376687 RepID=UPI0040411937